MLPSIKNTYFICVIGSQIHFEVAKILRSCLRKFCESQPWKKPNREFFSTTISLNERYQNKNIRKSRTPKHCRQLLFDERCSTAKIYRFHYNLKLTQPYLPNVIQRLKSLENMLPNRGFHPLTPKTIPNGLFLYLFRGLPPPAPPLGGIFSSNIFHL